MQVTIGDLQHASSVFDETQDLNESQRALISKQGTTSDANDILTVKQASINYLNSEVLSGSSKNRPET